MTQIVGKKLPHNYSVRSYTFETFVHGKGLWDYRIGDKACPKVRNELCIGDEEAYNQWKEEVVAYQNWMEKLRKIMHWMSLFVSDFFIPHLKKSSLL